MAPDGIAPIGVAAVGDDVARLQDVRELCEHPVDRRARRHIQHDKARRRQRRRQRLEIGCHLDAVMLQFFGHRMRVDAGDLEADAERVLGHTGAHLAEADDTDVLNGIWYMGNLLNRTGKGETTVAISLYLKWSHRDNEQSR